MTWRLADADSLALWGQAQRDDDHQWIVLDYMNYEYRWGNDAEARSSNSPSYFNRYAIHVDEFWKYVRYHQLPACMLAIGREQLEAREATQCKA